MNIGNGTWLIPPGERILEMSLRDHILDSMNDEKRDQQREKTVRFTDIYGAERIPGASERKGLDELYTPEVRARVLSEPGIPEEVRRLIRENAELSKYRISALGNYLFMLAYEDREDHHPYLDLTPRNFVSFQMLSPEQLRGYLTFRTFYRDFEKEARGLKLSRLRLEVKKMLASTDGAVYRFQNPTLQKLSGSRSYLLLYLEELISNVGTTSPEDSLWRMLLLYLTCGSRNRGVLFQQWIDDYIIASDLPASDLIRDYPDDRRAFALLSAERNEEESDGDYLDAVLYFSSYDVERSACFRAERELFRRVLSEVLLAVNRALAESGLPLLSEQTLGGQRIQSYSPFNGLVHYFPKGEGNVEYPLTPSRSVRRNGGEWKLSRAFSAPLVGKSAAYGEIVRETDRLYRLYRNGVPLIKRLKNPRLAPVIAETFRRLFGSEPGETEAGSFVPAVEEKEEIKIDLDRLSAIRRDADYVAERLYVPDESEDSATGRKMETALMKENGISEIDAAGLSRTQKIGSSGMNVPGQGVPESEAAADGALSELQIEFLRVLLNGGDGSHFLLEHHQPEALFVDRLNEIFMDEIGDTAIEFKDGHPVPVEDYREELEKILE